MLPALLLLWNAAFAASYPLDQLRTGQTGYGLTAGPGNVIERFPIEVLGLQQDIGAGFPVVLIRASGEFISQSGGVAAGMSGSPVYLPHDGEDALLGAIGFTFPSSDHQLALVTPIEIMKRAAPHLAVEPFGEEHFAGLGEAVPVATPLLMSGLSARAAALLEPLFTGPITPFTAQVSGASSARDETYTLQPGSAVSVQLVRGDITIAAVGTATLIEDDRFWAFGHPLLGQGEVSFALAPAYVSFIVPSEVVPFKLADNGKRLLGTVTQDRPYAISGMLDTPPGFIPVSLTLNGPLGSVIKRFEVTADERYYAPLLAAASLQAVDGVLEQLSAGTAELAWEIHFESGRTLRLLEQVTDPADLAAVVAGLAAEPLAVLADNVFEAPHIARVDLNVTFDMQQRYAEVVKVDVERTELKAGEMLTLYVRLQPYRAAPEVKTVRVPLPEGITGDLEVTVRGGSEPEPENQDDEPPLLSFDELLIALQDHTQASELIVEAFVDGSYEKLERLPLPYPITGSERVMIDIDSGKVDEGEEDGDLIAPPEETPETPLLPTPIPDEPR